MMKNKGIAWIAACLMGCALLAGCGHEHTWTDATCTEPKTCSECGETEGEALGHTWVDATCTEPKTCSVCGETEGEALGHDWVEATVTEPRTCSVCGETEGDPLTASFESMDVKGQFMEVGKAYPYVTLCYDNPLYKTTCDATITNYEIVESTDTLEAREGYEWRIVDAEILIYDGNANMFGYSVATCNEDYYDIIGYDESIVTDNEPEGGYDWAKTFNVTWNGEEYDCLLYMVGDSTGWRDDNTVLLTKHYMYQVPVGYDGCIIGFRDSATEWEDGMHIFDVADDNTLFFRLA